MRQEYQRSPGTSVLTWLLCGLGSAYFLQLIVRLIGNSSYELLLGLRPQSLAMGKVWALFTYPLLNDHFLIALANGMGLYLAGREVLPLLGAKRFCGLLFVAAVGGGLTWLAVQTAHPTDATLVGASALTTALLVVFACVYPEKEIDFLLFFILPLRVRPRTLLWVLLTFELIGLAFSELAGGRYSTGIAHSAHLGGMLAGWLLHRFFHAKNGWDRADGGPLFALPSWLRRAKHAETPKYKVNITAPTNLKSEVDRILDKINSTGFSSLTDEEKRLLDEAKDLLSRH